ncbi:MAG: hypothetical protein ABJL49_05600 [Parasphingorhabdus sp.]|uniref:hypothetical protein n=1 Tax=Alphaproteobacteria TaxID=28211 RepID=UPI003263AF21
MSDMRDTLTGIIAREVMDAEATADAIIAALPGRVLPLEWLGGGKRHHAGNYVIEDISTPRREIRRLLHASFGTTYLADFGGDRPLKAAKAAAQAHHTAAILSAFGVQGGEA